MKLTLIIVVAFGLDFNAYLYFVFPWANVDKHFTSCLQVLSVHTVYVLQLFSFVLFVC